MIVNATDQGWHIIFQRAHALLAGKIAVHWKNKPSPERWTETLAAIIDHDDGQKDWRERTHLTEAGAPMDFTILELDLEQAKKVVDHARYRSRWIALLTSMHSSALYEKMRDRSKAINTFLDEQRAYQTKLKHSLKIKKEDAEQAYRLMFLCDACSLVLCKDEVPAGGRKLEMGTCPDGKSCFIFAKKESLLSVAPWPFETDHFQVSTEIFQLNQLAYKNDQAFYEALDKAEVKVKNWYFEK